MKKFSISFFKEHSEDFIYAFELIVIIGVAIMTTILRGGFDVKRFSIISWITSFIYSIFAKSISTRWKKQKCLMDEDIRFLETSIKSRRDQLLRDNQTDLFRKHLLYRNHKKKLNYYLAKLDNKMSKLKSSVNAEKKFRQIESLRKRAVELLSLLNDKRFDEYENAINNSSEINPYSLNVKYAENRYGDLWVHEKGSIQNDDNTKSINGRAQFIYSIVPVAIMLVVNFIFSCFYINDYIQSGQAWIDLCNYTLTIGLGGYSGLGIGEKVILTDYRSTLQNRITVIKEVMQSANIEKGPTSK